MKQLKKSLTDPRLFLFLAPLILLAPVYITGKALFWGTSATQFVPWWDYAWKTILSGQLPLWNPLVGMGAPLAANYQIALFYPPTWIYFIAYLLGGIKWMAWFVTLLVCAHLIWSGIGTALLLKQFGASKFGQTVGGLAFSLSGYLVARAGFLSINATVAWIPWLLLYLYHLSAGTTKNLTKLTGVLVMLLLAGHAQTAWMAILLGGIWVIFWGTSLGDNGRAKNLGRSLAGYIGAGVFATAISAIQLIPTAEYLLSSQRAAEYGIEGAMTYSFWPWRFITLVLPDLFGNPGTGDYWGYANYWEDAVYIGLFPLLLALGLLIRSIIKSGKKNQGIHERKIANLGVFLGALILISFMIALGKNTVVFPFLYKNIPGFDLFQAPTRYTIIAVMALSILAGLGADQLTKPTGRRLYFTRLAAAGCFSVSAGAIIAGMYLPDIRSSFLFSAAKTGVIGLLVAVSYLAQPEKSDQKKTQIWNLVVICLVCMDLTSAGWGLNPGIKTSFYDLPNSREIEGRIWMPSDVEYDLKFNTFFKFESFIPDNPWEDMHQAYLPNLAMLQSAEMVNNFDPIVPGYFQEWIEGINAKNPETQILEMMNINSIIHLSDIGVAELLPMDLENIPVRVTGCAGVIEPDEQDLDLVLSSEINLLRDILIFSEDQITCSPGVGGKAVIAEEKNGYIKIELDLDQDGWIFWSQAWYPGWIYRIDGGKGGEVYRVNYLFQGAPVAGNAQHVEFVYQPASYYWGSEISFVSLALGAVISTIRNKKAKPMK